MHAVAGSQSFRRADHVRSPRDYAQSRALGKRASSRYFVVEISPGGAAPRLGLVVSRKVGSAVARNRVKRTVREWFRRHRGQMGPAADIVVIARPGAAMLGTQESWAILSDLTQKAAR
jgi:ribonuclease P protein component